MAAFLDFVASVWLVIWGALTLDASAAGAFRAHPLSFELAVTVAALAGASTLLGDSVVLFLNRVRGWRFVITLLLNGVGFVLLYALQALVIAVVGPLVVGGGPPLEIVTQGVMVSTAPMVFGFFVLIPYFGPAIARILQAWGLIVLWVVVESLFATGPWPALLVTAIGWAVMQLLSWSLAGPAKWVGDRIWRLATGRPSMMTGKDLLSGQMFLPLESGHGTEGKR